MGRALRLGQVVGNLIDNAVKPSPKAGQIAVIVQVEGNQVIFKVEDSGPGISSADLPFIFDKFFRVNDTDQGATTGTGLGLAFCKSIIEKYNGHIWAENRPDRGSIFTFTLPLAPPDEANLLEFPTLETKTLAA